ncbi:MAG TPA: PmoA family protein, partial [Lacipirellulaceae bacterium]|nr:PmoA family protein [Lacipirellulaceae bacterium]
MGGTCHAMCRQNNVRRRFAVVVLIFAASRSVSFAQAAEGFAWEAGEWETTLLYDGRPALRYMHRPYDDSSAGAREETIKPFWHVYSPDGQVLLTKGAGGLYTHPRGLFYGFNKVTYGGGRTCDVWHCTDGAHQAHVAELSSDANEHRASYLA